MSTNKKLKQRSRNILRRASRVCSGMTDKSLDDLLASCNGSVKLAIVVAEKGLTLVEGRRQLESAQSVLANILESENSRGPNDNTVLATEPSSRPELPVLCVDGGGSKSAALVGVSNRRQVGKGNSGPGNLYGNILFKVFFPPSKYLTHILFRTDGHFASTVNSIVSAAREALQSLNENDKNVLANSSARRQRPGRSFGSAWIACAGMDRPGMRERVLKDLLPALELDEEIPVRITNDVDLLAAAMARHPETPSSMVVIAGTGSIAIRYAQDSKQQQTTPRRTARSGGWGHLLGDEGAGYTIGRQAVRQALSSIEDVNLGLRSNLSPLERGIIAFYGKNEDDHAGNIDLLSGILVSGGDDASSNAKTRIASITQTILDAAANGDQEAKAIILAEMAQLIDGTLGRLLDHRSKGYVDPSQCGLILSGGVMLHPAYQDIFQHSLAKRGIRFNYTELVPDAALVGVEYLLQTSRVEGGVGKA